ncbi:hypothetical protein [Parabacteroides bouchesdurhonensis]|uniref:hypothetical protein n=1 Tax=Parabacteroides bouchesdurhonensis TaxID=1936995 RepID=UPI001D0C4769|nr:hypothetical protein [Parabacteroides bouchesdurhonensis]
MKLYNHKSLLQIFILFVFLSQNILAQKVINISAHTDNDLFLLLTEEGMDVKRYDTPAQAIEEAAKGDGVIITATGYPDKPTVITKELYDLAARKHLRLYVEFVNEYPGIQIAKDLYTGKLERGVISSKFFLPLQPMSLLALNDCHIYKAEVKNPYISFAKVAGYDVAQYGLSDTEVFPLLFKEKNTMIAMSCLSNFKTARYAPNASWKSVWEHILSWVTNRKDISLTKWESDPQPSYAENATLPEDARTTSIRKGADWLYNGRFLIHPSWKERALEIQGDGLMPVGPPVPLDALVGNGSDGVLEGHASTIYYDGTEQYRYWLRNDVQGEVAFLLASAGSLLNNDKYDETSEHLMDYMFYEANFRQGPRANKDSASYGLLGWSATHPYVFYNDDNARSLLGVIGASAYLKNERWNKFVVECILANLRISSKQGFQGGRLEEPQILENGWKFYGERDYVNPHPHFESWMWACYLWLYNKTGYKPLLEKAKTAIRITMEAYPDKWGWTNGIQQERARMILPLAWLVRVEDTPEHRAWLDTVVQEVLKNQVACGAIREELGSSATGMFGGAKSNKDYGLHEAPLIAENGDPVADMLYTCNFGFFALNEAAHATGNPQYKEAVDKLSDFLIRIQVKSDKHKDLDGAWMRAFDYNRWDYWASNADAGWGAWSTLTGWIQSWIIGTQTLVEKNQSYWDITHDINVSQEMQDAMWMVK